MNDQTLHISDVGQQRKDLEGIDELPGFVLTALDLEGENRAASVGEVLLIEFVVVVTLERRMIHTCYFRMILQEVHHRQSVLYVALDAQAQSLHTLQQDERIEGRNGSTRIAKHHRTDASHKGCRPSHIGKDRTVVRGVGLRQRRETVGIGFPVKRTAIDDDTAQRGAMTTQKFGGGVNHDVCAVLQRANQERSAEGVVDDEGNTVLVSHGGHSFQIEDIGVRIAEGLSINHFRIRPDSSFEGVEIIHIDNRVGDALSG